MSVTSNTGLFQGVSPTPLDGIAVQSAADQAAASAASALAEANAAAQQAQLASSMAVAAQTALNTIVTTQSSSATTLATGTTTLRTLGDRAADVRNIKDFGAVADGMRVRTNVSVAIGSTTLTVSSSIFSPADVGKILNVTRDDVYTGANPWYLGGGGSRAHVTIVGYVSPTQVTVNFPGSDVPPGIGTIIPTQSFPYVAVPSWVMWGTDNSPALQAAANAVAAAGGGEIVVPRGNFVCGTSVVLASNTTVAGVGAGSNLMLCGIHTSKGHSGVVPLFVNTAYIGQDDDRTNYTIPDYGVPAFRAAHGDHDIHFRDLGFDCYAGGTIVSRMELVQRTSARRCVLIGNPLNGYEGFNHIGCDTVLLEENDYENAMFVTQPWNGCTNYVVRKNTIRVPPMTGTPVQYGPTAYAAVEINSIGISSTINAQLSSDFDISENTFVLSGSTDSRLGSSAITLFPDGPQSPIVRVSIRNNKIISTGANNTAILSVGAIQDADVRGNQIISTDGNPLVPIFFASIGHTPAIPGSATSISTTSGSSVLSVTWPNHGYTMAIPYPVFLILGDGFPVGGVSIPGRYRIIGITNGNTLTIQGTVTATSTASASLVGTFSQIAEFPVGVTVAGNQLVDCTNATQGLINVAGGSLVVSDNAISLSSGAATGAFPSLVQVDGLTGFPAPIVMNNTGPTGTLSIGGLGGNNRVSWGIYDPLPCVVDPGASAVAITGTLSASSFVGPLTGNVSGTAANITGVAAVANGGTGATTASAALTALGGLSTATAASTYAPQANASFTGATSFGGNVTLSSSSWYNPAVIVSNTSPSATAGYVSFYKSRSGASVLAGDTLGTTLWNASDVTGASQQVAAIYVTASAAPGTGYVPTLMGFNVTTSSGAGVTPLVLTGSGVAITGTLSATGAITASGSVNGAGANFLNAETHITNAGTFTDPDPGVGRSLRVSGQGLAVSGGTKTDALVIGTVPQSPYTSAPLFGTGADGAVTISSGVTTLSRDMHYTNLTISGTGGIMTNGFRVFVSGTLDISAAGARAFTSINTIAGSNSVGAALGGAANPTGYGTIGGGTQTNGVSSGGSTGAGAAGGSPQVFSGNSIAQGGDVGAGGGGGAGTAAGGAGSPAGVSGSRINAQLTTPTIDFSCPFNLYAFASNLPFFGGCGASAGGNGGGDGTNSGGAGGQGGGGAGCMAIYARFIQRGTNTTTGILWAKGQPGGLGGSGTGGNAGGGGGGAGGGGGFIYVVCEALLGSPIPNAIDVSGGTGGNGGVGSGTGKGGNGGAGSNGGNAQVLVLSAPSFTTTSFNAAGAAGATTTTATGGAGGAGATVRATL